MLQSRSDRWMKRCFRKEYYRNPRPSEDEKTPVPLKNVILFFPVLEKNKKKGKTTQKIPSSTRERLWNMREMIFGSE